MAIRLHRYEAVVKLNTGEVVTYHNINTGLFKFHRFVCEKFSKTQKWVFYKVRRKENKEIVGTFVNAIEEKAIPAIKIFVENNLNDRGTGYIFSLPFVRGEYTLNRSLFLAITQVLARNSDYICFSEVMYRKMINEAKNALYEFYLDKGHQIMPDEFELGEFAFEKIIFVKQAKVGTSPLVDYP